MNSWIRPNKKNFPYGRDHTGQYLVLDYKSGAKELPQYKIMFYLPNDDFTVGDFSFARQPSLDTSLPVSILIPKGTIAMPPVDICGFAKELGIKGVFESMPAIGARVGLDLWNLSCTVTFNEEGAEAAAASAFVAGTRGIGGSVERQFFLNKPFAFCIYAEVFKFDGSVQVVELFTGEVTKASQIASV